MFAALVLEKFLPQQLSWELLENKPWDIAQSVAWSYFQQAFVVLAWNSSIRHICASCL